MWVGNIHIYRAKDQPATRYWVGFSETDGIWIRHKSRSRCRCFKCKKLRWAKNMIAHVYYDGVYYFCKAGKGCKA